jgi:hypothetical protein
MRSIDWQQFTTDGLANLARARRYLQRNRWRVGFGTAVVVIVAVLAGVGVYYGHAGSSAPSVPAGAGSMAGSLRPAYGEELSGIQLLSSGIPNWDAARGHVYVATRDIHTVAVNTPMIILVPRAARDPHKVLRWLGGQLGEITLLFQGKEDWPGQQWSMYNAVVDSVVYYDPICQLVPLGFATWHTCVNTADRRPATPQQMLSATRPASYGEVNAWYAAPAHPSAIDVEMWRVASGPVSIHPSRSRLSGVNLILAKGARVTGGRLGLNDVESNATPGGKRFALSDALCVDFNQGDPSYRRTIVDQFVPASVVKYYQSACPYQG